MVTFTGVELELRKSEAPAYVATMSWLPTFNSRCEDGEHLASPDAILALQTTVLPDRNLMVPAGFPDVALIWRPAPATSPCRVSPSPN